MPFQPRKIESQLLKASKSFPALILTGPRRAGKTTLLKKLFPKASYYLLEDPDLIARIQADPKGFLNQISLPVILDEIQNIPELFNYVRSLIDQNPHQKGKWFFTGSQEHGLMKGVSESMAGRAAVFQLYPFSQNENSKVSLLNGGYPEAIKNKASRDIWYRSYLQTYLERDVRTVSAIKNLSTFRRFIFLLCSRIGKILNKSDLAAPLGVSVPTLTEWINILEITSQIILVPPYFENFGKRLTKSPKLYWMDTGLACHLLGIQNKSDLEKSPFLGELFESFVVSEIIKNQTSHGKSKEIYFFRDEQGLEVDFLVPLKQNTLALLEVKASHTLFPQMTNPMYRLEKSVSSNYKTNKFLIYRPLKEESQFLSDTQALSCNNFIENILLKRFK